MGVHSGKRGAVNGQSTVRNWTITDDMTNPLAIASNTKQAPVRSSGIETWAGGFQAYGGNPNIMPGDIFAFLGYTAPLDDVSGAGERYSGNAIVDSIGINWNWQGGEHIGYNVGFSGHLGLAIAQGAAVTDVTAPDVPSICGTKIEYSLNGTDWFPVPAVASATLNLIRNNTQYVNSDTACATGRKAGTFDWNASIVQQEVIRGTYAFDKGDNVQFRFYIDDTDFWLLKWGKIRNFTGITVDIETGAIIARTINTEMNGHVAGVAGEVRKPAAGAAWWPFV